MKRDLRLTAGLFACAGTLFLGVAPTHGQSEQNTNSSYSSVANGDFYLQSSGRFGRAGDLIGMQVVDQQNQRVGQVKDIVVDLTNGRVPLAIISTPYGDKLVALPPQFLAPRQGQKALVLNLDREKLVTAPGFVAGSAPDFRNPAWTGSVYSYYRQPTYWQTARTSTAPIISESAGSLRTPVWISGRDQDQDVDQIFRKYQAGKMQARITDEQIAASVAEPLYPQYPSTTAIQSARRGTVSEAAGAQAPSGQPGQFSQPGQLTRTTDLIGTTVKDTNGETLGRVKDVVIDWPATRIAYAVVAPVGASDRYVAVPPSALEHTDAAAKTVVLNTDKEKLSAAPGFTGASWPDPSDQTFLAQVYHYYGQTPYWEGGAGNVVK